MTLKFFCCAEFPIMRPAPKRESSNLALEKKVWPPPVYNDNHFDVAV
jgi:hypothetical protein